jgi:Cdc6-like AAA superfamily ATPase
MGMLEKNAGDMHNVAVPHSDICLNELKTLSLHSKLILCACIRLFSRDSNAKVTPMDVFTEYKKLAARFNVNWLSAGKVTEHIKELEMLGFLKCTYPRRGQGRQIRYIHIFEPTEIPKYVSVLKEDLGKDMGKIQ